ncbi:hypothetical protein [Photobacterium kishitanii]|nr:hypothetical protein [Photobacterium kishitanii]
MLGFVGLLSGSLAVIFLVFIIMLLSCIAAQMAPTDGEYVFKQTTGLTFPVESYVLTDDILKNVVDTYRGIKKNTGMLDFSTTCEYGQDIDSITASQYLTYNYIYLKKAAKDGVLGSYGKVDVSSPVFVRNGKPNGCFLNINGAKAI